jgi:hypothetical protein
MATTAVIYGAGDTCSQVLTPIFKNEKSSFSLVRNIGQASFGLFLLGPFYHHYFKTLDMVVKVPGWRGTALKLIIDQTIGATLIISGFATWNTMFRGGSFQDVQNELKNNFFNIMKMNWMVWPAAGVISFGVVPTEYRTLFVNVVAFFWSAYLSYIFAGTKSTEPTPQVVTTLIETKKIGN